MRVCTIFTVGFFSSRFFSFKNVYFSITSTLIINSALIVISGSVFAAEAEKPKAALPTDDAQLTTDDKFLAQNQLPSKTSAPEDVIVLTAYRTNFLDNVKDIPSSISVVTGEELETFETSRFQDVLKKLGNIRIAGATGLVTGQNLSIRGIGFPGGSPQDPGIGVNVDGVSYAFTDMAGSFNFYDLESVDVARGAQGTKGGLGANYGRITFHTKAPSFTKDAEATVEFGQRNTLVTRAALGGGVIDDLLAYRVTFLREEADGPYVNQYDISQSLYNKDRTSAKIQFLLTPTANFTARFSADFTPKGAESGSSSFGAFSRATPDYYDTLGTDGNPIKVDQSLENAGRLYRPWFKQDNSYSYLDADGKKDRLERSDGPPAERNTGGLASELEWKLDDYVLNSITAWREYKFQWHGKNTGLRDIFDIMREPSQAWTYYKQFSQEFSITSDFDTNLNFKTGVYYLSTQALSGKPGWGTRYGSDAAAFYATTGQYNALDVNAAGRYLLVNSVDRINIAANSKTEGNKLAWFGNIDWSVTDAINLNVGLRFDDAHSQQLDSSSYISHQGYAPELNPVFVNNIQLGGFYSDAKTGALGSGTTQNSETQLALANSVALKYFSVIGYDNLTVNQKSQVAAAKGIRSGRIGSIYGYTDAEPFDDILTSANISPSYAISENQTAYFSWQHGEKAGVSQIVGATLNGGKSALTEAEKTDNYELGLKSTLLSNKLVLNTSIYYLDVSNYIQTAYYYDDAQTKANADGKPAYTSGLGNVPKISAKGVEIDVAYSFTDTTVRFAGAYSDPRYDDFKYSAKPPELGGDAKAPPYYDISGETLAGASKVSFNLSVNNEIRVFNNKKLHTSVNYNYVSSFNPSSTLSRYAKQDGYGLTDLAIGLSTRDKDFDITLIARNVFNVDYGSLYDWNSYSPNEPRWLGVSINNKFY